MEAPEWDGDASCDIKRDLGKTMVQRLFHWGPLTVVCITLIVCSNHRSCNTSVFSSLFLNSKRILLLLTFSFLGYIYNIYMFKSYIKENTDFSDWNCYNVYAFAVVAFNYSSFILASFTFLTIQLSDSN